MTYQKPIFLLSFILLASCSTTPPRNITNSCDIFQEKSGWYKAMKRVQKRYGTPIHVQLAIMRQESSFKHNARTERTHILWVIPWGRKSTAYGYAQVKDGTWDWYKQKTGNRGADRDDFNDAADFIGWYTTVSQKTLGISKWDAENQYLAYHEGHGGFKRKTYRKKAWLMKVAKKVKRNSLQYAAQLKKCENDLDRGFWLWPF
ncbi:transglycosylase SLT domain-containing protein [Paremcibacter congregatus]|uniref:transglycosylase SLT domain-containing protein n=1 Tax=Paremcibacter congregatus TaxID=2043170 RepID=UPI003A8F64FB